MRQLSWFNSDENYENAYSNKIFLCEILEFQGMLERASA